MNSDTATNTLENKKSTKSTLDQRELFGKILKNVTNKDFSLAIWRLPENETIHLIIDTNGYEVLDEIDLEDLEKGFLFCPYNKGKQILIRRHISYSTVTHEFDYSSEIEPAIQEEFEDSLLDQQEENTDRIHSGIYSSEIDEVTETTKETYCRIVADSIEAIKSGSFEKVVPSRIKNLTLDVNFDVIDCLFDLFEAYHRSFVYFVTAPEIGSWMGASPEILIEVEEGKKFRTISLAGTQRLEPGITPGSVAWTQKDIEEQALVSRYIINCFKKIRLREFEEKGPKTVIAGKLLHLKTVFEVDMINTGFHNLGTVMLKLLHPTSAVCGMPKEIAEEFLHKVEQHSRRYFCGFLGPVDNSQNTHLYVNLRCMELFSDHAILYAGAGVTEDSDPEKEWEETEIKCNTLLEIIAGN